jgi:hypothetical protein
MFVKICPGQNVRRAPPKGDLCYGFERELQVMLLCPSLLHDSCCCKLSFFCYGAVDLEHVHGLALDVCRSFLQHRTRMQRWLRESYDKTYPKPYRKLDERPREDNAVLDLIARSEVVVCTAFCRKPARLEDINITSQAEEECYANG